MIGANASVLGNIRIGEYSKVGAGSVVVARCAAALHRGGRAGQNRGQIGGQNRPREMDQRISGAAHHSSRGNLLAQNALAPRPSETLTFQTACVFIKELRPDPKKASPTINSGCE